VYKSLVSQKNPNLLMYQTLRFWMNLSFYFTSRICMDEFCMLYGMVNLHEIMYDEFVWIMKLEWNMLYMDV